MSLQRRGELRALAETHLGAIGLTSPEDFLREIEGLQIGYLDDPVIIYPQADYVLGQQQFIFEERE